MCYAAGMSEERFGGSVPATYESSMVPLFFAPYARELAARVAAHAPRAVLETAAGTGVVTRELHRRLAPDVRIVATDLSAEMLVVAEERLAAPRIELRATDACALPFGDAEFDVVTSQFGVMFFPDRPCAYREARRVLRPAGRFVFSVWDSLARNLASALVSEAAAAHFPHDPPRFFERVPFAYHDGTTIRRELEAAGFHDVTIDVVELELRADRAEDVASALALGTPLRGELIARGGDLQAFVRRATEHLALRFGPGPIDDRMSALVISAM